jgi:hypothetical protein
MFSLVNEYMVDVLRFSVEQKELEEYKKLDRGILFMTSALNLISPRLSTSKNWSKQYADANDLLKKLKERSFHLNDDIPF